MKPTSLAETPACILCQSVHTKYLCTLPAKTPRLYFYCDRCELRFLNPAQRLSASVEKQRYEIHENDVTNPGYQNFVRPIVDAVVAELPQTANGLDFGCGTGPVLFEMLQAAGYAMQKYDPFFEPNAAALAREYDFIVSSEVVEHFYFPDQEFARLNTLLKPGGTLALMTLLFQNQTSFEDWYYIKDPTHVALYSPASFDYIAKTFGFSGVEILSDRLVLLRK